MIFVKYNTRNNIEIVIGKNVPSDMSRANILETTLKKNGLTFLSKTKTILQLHYWTTI